MTVFDKGLIIVMSCAALFIALAIPLVLRKVPPNAAYGFRTRTTLRDEKAWYETNDRFARWLIAGSIASAVCVYVLYTTRWLAAGRFLTATIVALAAPIVVATMAGAYHLGSQGRKR
jgi:uncharacterized membrane protein